MAPQATHGGDALGPPPSVLWITRGGPGARPAGAEVYSFGLLEALAGAGAATTFVGLGSPDDARTAGEASGALSEVDWRVMPTRERGTVAALASRLPLVAARSSPPPVVALLREVLRERSFDVVVFDNYVAGWALDIVDAAARKPILAVYVAHNDESRLAADIADAFEGDPLRRWALRLNAAKIRRLETRLLRRVDLLVTLTEHDRDRMAPTNASLPRLVLPPGYTSRRRPSRRITAEVPRRIAMVGSVRWIAKRMNVAAFLHAADARLAAARIALDIIGDVPDDFRAEWEPRLAATRFRGFVDDLDRELDATRLGLVVEATGGGFKLKTLDYIFNRVPVAALAGSSEGFPRAVAETFLTAPDMAGLTGRVIAAIDDLDDLNARQQAAFAAADQAFSWPENGRRLLAAISDLRGDAAAARRSGTEAKAVRGAPSCPPRRAPSARARPARAHLSGEEAS